MRIKTSGYGVKRVARRVAAFVDRLYSKTLRLMRHTGPVRSVRVIGIYREAEPIRSAVAELRKTRHDLDVKLGSMDSARGVLEEDTLAQHMTGGKFQNLNRLLEGAAPVDWIVIIDDDVLLPPGFLDHAVELCERLGYALAQPAQTRNSNANWVIVKQRLLTVARDSLFVEIGPVTLIRRDAAQILLPFPADLRFGWGLDFEWAQQMRANGLRAGILDGVAVEHAARKVASTYSWDAAQEEGRAYLAGVDHMVPEVAMTPHGRRHRAIPRALRQA